MRALVTGAAGFIGSHLSQRLLAEGMWVRAIDSLTPYYNILQKGVNLSGFQEHPRCEVLLDDLRSADVDELCRDVDVVFHHAAQPGVRRSWAAGFEDYTGHNILVTQRLLEAATAAKVKRFVYASSSSVYGNLTELSTTEQMLPRPFSPYGVTKLAAEHLCNLYAENYGLPTVSLRYFTVYGARQRPDMAMHRLIEAALTGAAFPLFGTGEQVRDFTYVGDVVEANLAAYTYDPPPGTVVNIAGGSATTMRQVIRLVEALTKREVRLDRRPTQPGDVNRTGGSIQLARHLLGWEPTIDLEEGLRSQVAWHTEVHSTPQPNPSVVMIRAAVNGAGEG